MVSNRFTFTVVVVFFTALILMSNRNEKFSLWTKMQPRRVVDCFVQEQALENGDVVVDLQGGEKMVFMLIPPGRGEDRQNSGRGCD